MINYDTLCRPSILICRRIVPTCTLRTGGLLMRAAWPLVLGFLLLIGLPALSLAVSVRGGSSLPDHCLLRPM